MEVYIENAGDGVTATSGSVSSLGARRGDNTRQCRGRGGGDQRRGHRRVGPGGGAEATNVILDDTNAYLSDSKIGAHRQRVDQRRRAATINAHILAASVAAAFGAGAAAASIGVGIAENYIGYS